MTYRRKRGLLTGELSDVKAFDMGRGTFDISHVHTSQRAWLLAGAIYFAPEVGEETVGSAAPDSRYFVRCTCIQAFNTETATNNMSLFSLRQIQRLCYEVVKPLDRYVLHAGRKAT